MLAERQFFGMKVDFSDLTICGCYVHAKCSNRIKLVWLQYLHILVTKCKNTGIDMLIFYRLFFKIFRRYWLDVDESNCYSMYQLAPIDITMSFIMVNGSELYLRKK